MGPVKNPNHPLSCAASWTAAASSLRSIVVRESEMESSGGGVMKDIWSGVWITWFGFGVMNAWVVVSSKGIRNFMVYTLR